MINCVIVLCSPFFGEEFQFEIPRRFRNLAFYLYDREKLVNSKDKVIGKVAIKRDELNKFHAKESWFPFVPVDADSEVQGKIHVEIKLDQCSKPGGTNVQKIAVRYVHYYFLSNTFIYLIINIQNCGMQ